MLLLEEEELHHVVGVCVHVTPYYMVEPFTRLGPDVQIGKGTTTDPLRNPVSGQQRA